MPFGKEEVNIWKKILQDRNVRGVVIGGIQEHQRSHWSALTAKALIGIKKNR